MKCPYRKEIHTMGDWTVENFAECYKEECPFYGKKERKKRYEGGYYEVINSICRRAQEESGDKE
jgi:hypothetical protein